ncbi:hypothetical protein [Sorangium cellulosum]|nr:hypothetical protein [Sorangium cellulosum]
MLSTQLVHHLSLEVSGPACPATYAGPLDVVEQSQGLLDGGALQGPEPS